MPPTADIAAGGTGDRTAQEVLTQHYRRLGLPADGGATAPRWQPLPRHLPWLCLPNFAWRRRALPLHDLHHLLLECPWTPAGEFQMAAWEFAAGRFRHPCATAFCLPLVGLGSLACPRRTLAAFLRGRRSRTLYAQGLTPEVLGSSMAELRRATLPEAVPAPVARDVLALAGWVGAAWLWMLTPLAIAAWLWSAAA